MVQQTMHHSVCLGSRRRLASEASQCQQIGAVAAEVDVAAVAVAAVAVAAVVVAFAVADG